MFRHAHERSVMVHTHFHTRTLRGILSLTLAAIGLTQYAGQQAALSGESLYIAQMQCVLLSAMRCDAGLLCFCSPASGPCSTDSPGSSLSIDEGEGDGWGGYGHSLTPDQPVILEESFSNDAWPGTASLRLPVRKFSPSQLPSNIPAGFAGQVRTEVALHTISNARI